MSFSMDGLKSFSWDRSQHGNWVQGTFNHFVTFTFLAGLAAFSSPAVNLGRPAVRLGKTRWFQ